MAKTEAQKSLTKWTKQKWRTNDGKVQVRKGIYLTRLGRH